MPSMLAYAYLFMHVCLEGIMTYNAMLIGQEQADSGGRKGWGWQTQSHH